jgi:hypothetical protein
MLRPLYPWERDLVLTVQEVGFALGISLDLAPNGIQEDHLVRSEMVHQLHYISYH